MDQFTRRIIGFGIHAGTVDGAGSFNGTTKYIDAGNASGIEITGNITVELWATTLDVPDCGNWRRTVNNYSSSGLGGYGMILRCHNGDSYDGKLVFDLRYAGSDYQAWTNSALTLGTVYHFAGTYDGSTVTIFQNGVAQTTTASLILGIGASTDDLVIGRDSTIAGYFWNGIIDEVRVSNVVRSAAWFAHEYYQQQPTGPYYTVGSWTP